MSSSSALRGREQTDGNRSGGSVAFKLAGRRKVSAGEFLCRVIAARSSNRIPLALVRVAPASAFKVSFLAVPRSLQSLDRRSRSRTATAFPSSMKTQPGGRSLPPAFT
jgi:hypothetical protein